MLRLSLILGKKASIFSSECMNGAEKEMTTVSCLGELLWFMSGVNLIFMTIYRIRELNQKQETPFWSCVKQYCPWIGSGLFIAGGVIKIGIAYGFFQ